MENVLIVRSEKQNHITTSQARKLQSSQTGTVLYSLCGCGSLQV